MIRPTYPGAMFEGPLSSRVAAWRHCFIWQTGRTAEMLSPDGGRKMAARLGFKFFPEGTWEAGPAKEGTFSKIKPEILAALRGESQTEMPI